MTSRTHRRGALTQEDNLEEKVRDYEAKIAALEPRGPSAPCARGSGLDRSPKLQVYRRRVIRQSNGGEARLKMSIKMPRSPR